MTTHMTGGAEFLDVSLKDIFTVGGTLGGAYLGSVNNLEQEEIKARVAAQQAGIEREQNMMIADNARFFVVAGIIGVVLAIIVKKGGVK